MPLVSPTLVLAIAVALWAISTYQHLQRKQKLAKVQAWRELPGPINLPLVGRIHDVPMTHSWTKFKAWGDQYGPIYQTYMFGEKHVWVMRDAIAHDILSKRGHIYSDRPGIPNIPGTKTEAEYLPLLGFNDAWKRQRKFGHHILQGNYQAKYHQYPLNEAKRLLVKLLESPSDYSYYLDQFTSRMICRLAYGYPDHSVDLKKNALALLEGISPAGKLPNILPQLMLLPESINPWKKEEKVRHAWEKDLYCGWRDQVQQEMIENRAKPSWTKTYLENRETFGFDDHEAAYAVGMMALAGVQTIGSPLNTFVYAMVHYPQWLLAIQKEIDEVCGNLMPTTADSPRLPTLRAVIKEGLRWRPPVPTGIPHELIQDDVYDGYFLPKGTHVHPLEWAISRDPDLYPEADEFKPERWLDERYPTFKAPLSQYPTIMNHHQFGYGRRICQGMELVDSETITACGAIAWAFSLTKPIDSSHVPEVKSYTSLLITKPQPFSFELKARSLEREKLIHENFEAAKKQDPQLVSKYDK